MNITQIDFVLKTLKKNGKISRNYCLKNSITRLGALIYKLKTQGYKIGAYREVKKGWGVGDYIYYLID